MTPNDKRVPLRLLVLTATPKLADKAAALFKRENLPLAYRFTGEGTASSEVLDMLGLDGSDKGMLATLLAKPAADAMLKKLRKELKLASTGSGIAFTVALTGVNALITHLLSQNGKTADQSARKDGNALNETKYAAIVAVVNRGFSGSVMECARHAGAGGGTVIHSYSQLGEIASVWGLNVQAEKDIVLILANAESRTAIMQAISEQCGVNSDAKGLVLSLPIESVIGMPED